MSNISTPRGPTSYTALGFLIPWFNVNVHTWMTIICPWGCCLSMRRIEAEQRWTLVVPSLHNISVKKTFICSKNLLLTTIPAWKITFLWGQLYSWYFFPLTENWFSIWKSCDNFVISKNCLHDEISWLLWIIKSLSCFKRLINVKTAMCGRVQSIEIQRKEKKKLAFKKERNEAAQPTMDLYRNNLTWADFNCRLFISAFKHHREIIIWVELGRSKWSFYSRFKGLSGLWEASQKQPIPWKMFMLGH